MKHIVLFFGLLLIVTIGIAQEVNKVKITELEKVISESKSPLIVNFWATFCIPCIEEIPHFQKQVKAHEKDSVKLLLVSLDLEDDYASVGPFAKKRKFTAPIVWLDETNADYFIPKIDSTWSGAIPASLFINNQKGYRKFVEEGLSEDELREEIESMVR